MVGPESPNGSTPQPAAKKYGITKPISIAGPTEADLQRNMDMEKVNFILFFQFLDWFNWLMFKNYIVRSS